MSSSEEESWDSKLLEWGTLPVFTIVYDDTTSYISMDTTSSLEYSSVSAASSGLMQQSSGMDSYYSSLLQETTQSEFAIDSGYSSSTITPTTWSYYSTANSAVSSSGDEESWDSDLLSRATQPVFSSFPGDDLNAESPVGSSSTHDSSTFNSLYSPGLSSQFASSVASVVSTEVGSALSEISGSSSLNGYTTSVSSLPSVIVNSQDRTLGSTSSMTVSINTNLASEAVTSESSDNSFSISTVSTDYSNGMTSSSASTSLLHSSGLGSPSSETTIASTASVDRASTSPISSTTITFSDVTSSLSSSSSEETSSCDEFTTITTTDIYGDMVLRAACIDSLLSTLEETSVSQSFSGVLTATTSTSVPISSGSSPKSSSFNPMVSNCDDYTVISTKDAYGSLVSETVCMESSTPTSASPDSTITTPTETVQTSLSSSSLVSELSSLSCDHPTLLVEEDSNGVLVSKTVCNEPSISTSQGWSSGESDTVTSSVSVSSILSTGIISSSSFSESVIDCTHFTVISSKDMYGSLVMTTACVDSEASSSVSASSKTVMNQATGSSTLAHSLETTLTCEKYAVSTTLDASGSIISKTICDELSHTSVLSGSNSEPTPTPASGSTGYSSTLSASKPTETMSTCEEMTTITTTDAGGLNILRAICAESSLASIYVDAPESTIQSATVSSSKEPSVLSSIEVSSSCHDITTITTTGASGSLGLKTMCADSSAVSDSSIVPSFSSALSSSYSSATVSTFSSLESHFSCEKTMKLTTTDANGSSFLTTACVESTLLSQSSIIIDSTSSASLVDSATSESLKTESICELKATITTADANGSTTLKTVCAESTSVSESGASTTRFGPSSTISTSSSLETPFVCDHFTTAIGKDVNGALISQILCVETASSSLVYSTSNTLVESTAVSSFASIGTSSVDSSSTVTNPAQISSLSSTVKSVNSYSSCEHLTTVYRKDVQGVLVPETICAGSTTSMGAITTFSSFSESSVSSIILVTGSVHLPLTVSSTDCDEFSTILAKDTYESLIPQTICVEPSTVVTSSGSLAISSISSATRTLSECDHYTTITGTNANGDLTSQTSCIEDHGLSDSTIVSSSSISDLISTTRIASALSSVSACDHYSTITATNTLGSLTSLIVCADSVSTSASVSTLLTSKLATSTISELQPTSALFGSKSGSKTSSGSSYLITSTSSSMAMTVSKLDKAAVSLILTIGPKTSSVSNPDIKQHVSTETTATISSTGLLASGISSSSKSDVATTPVLTQSIISSGGADTSSSTQATGLGPSATSVYEGSFQGLCATGPLSTHNAALGSDTNTSTGTVTNGNSPGICNTINTMDYATTATPTAAFSGSSTDSTSTLDTNFSRGQASESVCAPATSADESLLSIQTGSPTVKSTDTSDAALPVCTPLETVATSSETTSLTSSSTIASLNQPSSSVVCDSQETGSASNSPECVNNVPNTSSTPDANTAKEEAVCDNGNTPESSSSGSSSSSSDEGACGNTLGLSSSSSSSSDSGKNGGFSSSSSSSSSDGGSSSSSSSSGGNGSSSSSSSSGSGSSSSSSSSSSSGGGSSSSSSSSGGNGGGSSSSSSSGGGSSSSSSSSFGRSFLDDCAGPDDCDTSPAKEPTTKSSKNARRSSRSHHSSTSSSSTSSTSKDASGGVRSSSTSKSETTTVEDSIIVARSNGTSTTTRRQTESTSVEDSFEEEDFEENASIEDQKNELSNNQESSKLEAFEHQDNEYLPVANQGNDIDTNKLVKQKRLLKRPALISKKTRRPRFLRRNRKKYRL